MNRMEAITKLRKVAERNNIDGMPIDNGNNLALLVSKQPTKQQLEEVRKELFLCSELRTRVSPDLLILNPDAMQVQLLWRPFRIFSGAYQALSSFADVHLVQAEALKDEVVFYYKIDKRVCLNSDELQYIQNSINPSLLEHDSIRVLGCNGCDIYTMYIRF